MHKQGLKYLRMHRMKKKHDLDYLIEPAYDHHSNPKKIMFVFFIK